MAVSSNAWSTLDRFRQAADVMFVRDVLPFGEKLSEYDQVLAAGREALESRGLDLGQEEQRYIVASVIAWMCNLEVGLVSQTCGDPHVFAHLKEAIQWPAYLLRELTLDVPLAEKEA